MIVYEDDKEVAPKFGGAKGKLRYTVVPALGDPRRERPPAVYGHVINVPIHLNVPIRPSDERPPALYGHFCLVPRVSVHDRYYCIFNGGV